VSASRPWILLRGLMRDSRHWGDFPQLFGHHNPGAEVLALDLPGNGALHRQRSPLQVEDMAEYCRAELVRRGQRPPYRVLAMSLGAMVTAAWAAAYPRELAATVLINTSLRPFSPFHQRLRPRVYPTVLRMALSDPGIRASEGAILRLTSNLPRAEVLEQWIVWRELRPVSTANALRQLAAAARFRAPRTAPAVPMLLLSSAADGLVDPRCSQKLAQAWHCPIRVHPDAGHDLPLDDGAWVAAQVRNWLQSRA
jgi:pimeloyl-ACP methyl ester carboxylesterase